MVGGSLGNWSVVSWLVGRWSLDLIKHVWGCDFA